MEIELDYTQDLANNANIYFEKSKKLKQKNVKILDILKKADKDLDKLNKLNDVEIKKLNDLDQNNKKNINIKKNWYNQFRMMITSSKNIILMGSDINTNEILISKYTTENDIVFHTMLAGSGYAVLNNKNFDVGIDFELNSNNFNDIMNDKKILDEICLFTAIFSKSAKSGLLNPEVFWIKRKQMLKTSPEGIKLPRGSYYIKGKKTTINYMDQQSGIGLFNDLILWGPLSVFENLNIDYIIFKSGNKKSSIVAKEIITAFKSLGNNITFGVDEVIKYIPYKKLDIDNYFLKRLITKKSRNK